MKISKERLKELVQEELAISFGSVAPPSGMEQLAAPAAKVSSDGEGYMAKQNLWKIAEYAGKLYELTQDSDCLEPWVEEKIAVAAYIMDSVGHYIEYSKHRSHEAAEGEMDHMETEMGHEAVIQPEEDEEYELEMEPEEEYEDEEEYEMGDEEDDSEDSEEYEDEEEA